MNISAQQNIALHNDRSFVFTDVVVELAMRSKSLVKVTLLFMGFAMRTDTLAEPALTLPGEINYGEFCQVNVVDYCSVNQCSPKTISPTTTKKLPQLMNPIT